MSKRFKFFILIVCGILLSLLLYHQLFNFYFFQDDYFNFNIVRVKNAWEFLSFFKFRDDIIAYRPISLQTYFFIMHQIFNFNAFAFRIVNFATLSMTYFLVMITSTKITQDKKIGFIAATLWITSAIHFMNIGVINYNLIGTFFWLATFIFFTKNYYLLSFIFFLITICSFEFSVTLPPVLAIYLFLQKDRTPFKILKVLFPFLAVSIIYLLLRQFYIKPPSITEYQIAFNLNSIKAFFWYLIWTFNVPEEFKKQISNHLIIFNEVFLRDYWRLVFKSFMGLFAVVLLGVIYPLLKLKKDKKTVNYKILIFLVLWFAITISPVLLLPNHTFMMYLTLPAIAVYLIIAYLICLTKDKLLICLVVLIWFFLSSTTLDFYRKNSFVVEAQKTSKQFSENMAREFPHLPKNSIVYYYLPYQEQRQALLDQNAIQALYEDSSLSIYYTNESLLEYIRHTRQTRPIYIYIP